MNNYEYLESIVFLTDTDLSFNLKSFCGVPRTYIGVSP